MKRAGVAVLLLLVLTGCHKKNPDGSPQGAGNMLGGCSYSAPKTYSGALVVGSCLDPNATVCQNKYQFVAVQADVTHYNDKIDVSICKTTGECQTMPYVGIGLAPKQVFFVNVTDGGTDVNGNPILGYSTYNISESLCR